MNTARFYAAASVTTAFIVLCAGPASAQGPDANSILEQSARYVESIKTLYGDVQSTLTSPGKGAVAMRVKIWAQMPENLVTHMEMPQGTMTAYFTGTQQATYFSTLNQYTIMTMPQPMAQPMLREVLGNSMLKAAGGKGFQATLVGKETVSEMVTNHVRVTTAEGMNADLWIADGPQPLPVAQKVSSTNPPLQTESQFHWIVDKPMAAGFFKFTPPAGARPMQGGAPGGAARPAAPPQQGAPPKR